MDRGSENVDVARYQVALHHSNSNERAGRCSIIYGSSPANSVSEIHWYYFPNRQFNFYIAD